VTEVPTKVRQRPFTLLGQAQKDYMTRITYENRKLLNAVQERGPTLNRNDWLKHRLDHEYQLAKMSEYKKTIPMTEILRHEMGWETPPPPPPPKPKRPKSAEQEPKWTFETIADAVKSTGDPNVNCDAVKPAVKARKPQKKVVGK
jgi:hypothetical protein